MMQATVKNDIPNLADKHLEQSVYSWRHVARLESHNVETTSHARSKVCHLAANSSDHHHSKSTWHCHVALHRNNDWPAGI